MVFRKKHVSLPGQSRSKAQRVLCWDLRLETDHIRWNPKPLSSPGLLTLQTQNDRLSPCRRPLQLVFRSNNAVEVSLGHLRTRIETFAKRERDSGLYSLRPASLPR